MRGGVVGVARERGCGGEPAGITPHDLNDRYTLNCVDKGIMCNLKHRRSNIFCSGTKARRVVSDRKVIVDRLWNADYTDRTADMVSVIGKL